MKKHVNFVKIDGEKLKAAIKAKGLMPSNISREFGFNYNYLSNAAYEGRLKKNVVILLETVHGIKLDEYKYVEPEPAPAPEPKPVPGPEPKPVEEKAEEKEHVTGPIDYTQLYKTVFVAMYRAIKRVIAEEGGLPNGHGRTA